MSYQDSQPLPFLAAFLSAVYSFVSYAFFTQGRGGVSKLVEQDQILESDQLEDIDEPLNRVPPNTYAHTQTVHKVSEVK
jgi:hypothetical protein